METAFCAWLKETISSGASKAVRNLAGGALYRDNPPRPPKRREYAQLALG